MSKSYTPVEGVEVADYHIICARTTDETTGVDDDAFEDEIALSLEDDEGGDRRAPPNIDDTGANAVVLGAAVSLGYCAVYFWRYPVFLLPPDVLGTPLATAFGAELDLQAGFSLAYIGGFGSAKVFGMRLVSSAFFFRNRLAVVCAMSLFTMTVECLGVWIFAAHPPLQVLSVFVSSFVSSWIYGAVFTYMEGRESTETLLAIMGGTFIFAGGASRGTATLVLRTGIPPLLMPLALGLVACPISCALFYLTDRQPRPSAADLASRSERRPISPAEQGAFLRRHAFGMATVYVAFAMLTGVRSFRDFYSGQIYAAALGEDAPPAWVFIVADLPGAIVASLVLYAFKSNRNHLSALRSMLLASCGGGLLILAATAGFVLGILGGFLWQVCLGIGLYVAFGILRGASSERIIAATGTKGTCTFLVFLGDCFGYIVTICILLARDFAPGDGEDDGGGNSDPGAVLRTFLILVFPGVSLAAVSLLAARYYFGKRLQMHGAGKTVVELNTLTRSIGEDSPAHVFRMSGASDTSIS